MLTMADGMKRLDISATMPAGFKTGGDVLDIPIGELSDLITAGDWVNQPDFQLGYTGSDTVNDKPMHTSGNAQTFGASNFAGNATVLRSFTDGKPDVDDKVFVLLGEKGARAWWFIRVGKDARIPLEVGDEGEIWETVSDDAQPQQEMTGYVKNTIPLAPQDHRYFKVVA